MYERFTDSARQVMQVANKESQRLCSKYIGTEHILLGMVAESQCVAAQILNRCGIDLNSLRREVYEIVGQGQKRVTKRKLPQTLKAKKVIERAIQRTTFRTIKGV